MSFSVGIVGLPNVGKSTLFKALTKKQIDIANYPFCTINPNVGIVKVPDERLETLAKISVSKEIIPTAIEFVDIAGLVKGASKGEGLGNQFLANIKEVDAIAHVVRAFEDSNVIHVDGKVDPKSDIEVINLELIMSDMVIVQKFLSAHRKESACGKDKALAKVVEILEKVLAAFEAGRPASSVALEIEERQLIKSLNLLTFKPVIYILNVDEEQMAHGQDKITEIIRLAGIPAETAIPISAKIEAELADMPDVDAKEYLKELGMEMSGLDQVIKASYKLLDLITFFTSGEKETRAWTVERGAKAPQAAGKIHSDFEKGFIRAEVIGYKDFVCSGGEVIARDKGLLRLEGKDYVTQDGDVVHFRFSV